LWGIPPPRGEKAKSRSAIDDAYPGIARTWPHRPQRPDLPRLPATIAPDRVARAALDAPARHRDIPGGRSFERPFRDASPPSRDSHVFRFYAPCRLAGAPGAAMIHAIVLAAGTSRRMGRPKALLRTDGISQIERTIRALREGGCDCVTVVVRRPDGAEPRAVRDTAERAADRVVEVGDGEQIDSLRAALQALSPGVRAVVVAPVDVPGLRGSTVAALVARHRSTGAPIVVPVAGGTRGHPVLFARSVFPELLSDSLAGGARTVVRAHEAELAEVDVGDPSLIADADTPAEWERLAPGDGSGGEG